MSQGAEVTDGRQKLTATYVSLSGTPPDLTSLKTEPILRPYTVRAVLRVEASAAFTGDLELVWQAIPRLPETQNLGPVVGLGD